MMLSKTKASDFACLMMDEKFKSLALDRGTRVLLINPATGADVIPVLDREVLAFVVDNVIIHENMKLG